MNDIIEYLAEASHQGWMAEKQRQGFVDHAFQGVLARHVSDAMPIMRCVICGGTTEKHHTDIVPYDHLAEHIKEYDRVIVRSVLWNLAKWLEGQANL